ncbi:DUF6759 domain-containing protein [Chryseobacterium sp. SORGH_AS_1048]|uniref:DUF6759 domain-containing protein n=1 Tax=Chryseobacterium sp. SORGH_AS_1048 TaxID=3041783 RepID=UPI00278B32A4|nr:DUF6759 domain-containing protein [Chryseobacterium sp. SORGH_AS_1048]MDQ1101768.1 hypothetical protein [Chryseobacterium sp. SORGH_AS_1048]
MRTYPVRKPVTRTYSTGSSTSPAAQVEREYQNLSKTYKPETAAVLTDLLNDSPNSITTSFMIENKSRCNIVLTISGNNYFKKIPIGAGKNGVVMVPKNQTYNLSGMVCDAVYQKTKLITGPSRITLSN